MDQFKRGCLIGLGIAFGLFLAANIYVFVWLGGMNTLGHLLR